MELVVLLLFSAGFWLLLVRPQQQRLRAQRSLIASLEPGDRVVTAGGLIGTIVRLDERDAEIEVAPGTVLTFLRPAVSRRLEPDEDGAGGAAAAGYGDENAQADGNGGAAYAAGDDDAGAAHGANDAGAAYGADDAGAAYGADDDIEGGRR